MTTALSKSRPTANNELFDHLIAPGQMSPRDEAALFGSAMSELGGLEPSQIKLNEVQHKLIEGLLDELERRIKEGRAEACRPAVHKVRDVIRGQFLLILRQVVQHHTDEAAALRDSVTLLEWPWKSLAKFNKSEGHKRIADGAEEIRASIELKVQSVMDALTSALVDHDETILDLRTLLASLQHLKAELDNTGTKSRNRLLLYPGEFTRARSSFLAAIGPVDHHEVRLNEFAQRLKKKKAPLGATNYSDIVSQVAVLIGELEGKIEHRKRALLNAYLEGTDTA